MIILNNERTSTSLGANIGIVGFRVVDFSKDGDDGLWELVDFHIPFLEDVYPRLWRTTTDMEEDTAFFEHSVDIVNCLLYVPIVQAIKRCFLNDAVHFKVRPLLCHVDSLPFYPSL